MQDGTDDAGDDARTRPTVLAIEDEEWLAELYEAWLTDEYEVVTALDGDAGLAAMSGDVDVVLLDRRLPGTKGDEVLHSIREEGHTTPVVMVTAVDPDVDIVDLPFDDYLTKPLTRDVLVDVVGRMLRLRAAEPAVRRYHSLERRRDVLRTASERSGTQDTEEAFEMLTTRLEAAAKDAGAGLAWLKQDYYEIE